MKHRAASLRQQSYFFNKKLNCRRAAARCSMSLEILLSHSRSLKVIRNYTAKYGMCKFLLVFRCNYVSILYRFWDNQRRIMANSWNLRLSKMAPIDRLYTSFYWRSTVIIALYCITSEKKRNIGWKSRFFTPPAFDNPVSVPVGILPQSFVRKS